MGLDASIAMSVQDNLSSAIVSMKNSMTAFRTDVKELEKELYFLNNSKTNIRVDMNAAMIQLKNAKKAFQELGEEATEAERKAAEADWKQAELNLENIRQQYDLVSRQVRQTTRDFETASGMASRMENRVGGSGGTGVLAALGKAGIMNMVGDSAGQWANTLVGSAFGSDVGTVFSSGLSSAVQGAAMGSLAGPVGTAVGAAIGGAIGLATGGSQIFQQRDEAFKSYVQEATQNQMEEMTSSISSGSDTAAQRELDAIAFNKLLGNGNGDDFLARLRTLAADTPMEYSDLTAMSRALATGFGRDTDRMLSLMTGIGNAGSAVGTDASGMTVMTQALSRMESSNKATLEYLNMFQERGVDVIGMLAKALNTDQGGIYDMISDGDISGTQAVDIIQQGLEQYAGAMDEMAKTFSGLESTLSDAQTELNNAYGEGYNETRKQGLREEINWLSGESGAMMQEANRAMGAWQAKLENSKEEYIRKSVEDVLYNSDDYKAAMAEGTDEGYAEAGRMLMEAKVRGMNEYNASEGAQLMVEYEIALADTIREDASTNSAYWDAGYRKGQEYSKGLIAGQAASTGFNLFDQEDAENFNKGAFATQDAIWAKLNGYAVGLDRVPYDNYPALLHQGERVLTAREAREQDGGRKSPIQITITGNSFGAGVSAEEIAQRLADQIELHLAAGVLS